MKIQVTLAAAVTSLAVAFAAAPANASPVGSGVSALHQTSSLLQTARYDGYNNYHERRRWWWRHRADEGRNWGWRSHRWNHDRRSGWDNRRRDRDRDWRHNY